MNITPLDIRKKEFRKSMRGCDVDEVETFLIDISEFMEALIAEKERLKAENELLAKDKISTEKKIKSDKANSDFSTARREAKLIIQKAELKALETIEKKKVERNRLHDEIIVLEQQKKTFIKRLKCLLVAQLDLIDVLEIQGDEGGKTENALKLEKRKKINFSSIQEMPQDIGDKIEEHSSNSLVDERPFQKRNTTTKEVNIDLQTIRQEAREILDKKDQKLKQDDIDLDSILGTIGE